MNDKIGVKNEYAMKMDIMVYTSINRKKKTRHYTLLKHYTFTHSQNHKRTEEQPI